MDLFKQIDKFLTDCEEYVEQRVWNGKFIGDLQYLSDQGKNHAKAKYHKSSEAVQASGPYITAMAQLHKIAGLLMQFQIIADIVHVTGGTIRLCLKYFAHYLFILIIGLASTNILLTNFKNAPFGFLLFLFPTLLINHLLLSAFFIFTGKKDAGGTFTRADIVKDFRATFPANLMLLLLQFATAMTFGVFFLGFAFVLSTIFETYHIDWSSSFLYWLLVVMSGLFMAVVLYIIEVIFAFAYPFVLQEKKSLKDALRRSLHSIQTEPDRSILLYNLFTLSSFLIIFQISKNYYEGGFFLMLFFLSQAVFFLGIMLRKNQFAKEAAPFTARLADTLHSLRLPQIILGIFSYIAVGSLFLQVHPHMLTFLETLRPAISVQHAFTTYQNDKAGYSISYPQPWSVYKWNDNAITIQTNTTGTETGEIKVNITLRPAAKSNYFTLYEANPGLISYDTGTKNVLTKSTNLVINGKNAVKYTYTKNEDDQPEFETHYLIRHEEKIYDVSFVTIDKRTELEHTEIFAAMIESFQIRQ